MAMCKVIVVCERHVNTHRPAATAVKLGSRRVDGRAALAASEITFCRVEFVILASATPLRALVLDYVLFIVGERVIGGRCKVRRRGVFIHQLGLGFGLLLRVRLRAPRRRWRWRWRRRRHGEYWDWY